MLNALSQLTLPPDVPSSVEVWLLDIHAATPHLPAALSILSANEHARYQRYKHPADAQRFALTRAALRQLLAEELHREPANLHFSYGPHGKPALSNNALQFNVSHGGEYGLITISTTHSVGVDIERHTDKPPHEVLASPIFTQEERASCATGDAAHFYDMWCRKEGALKAEGIGFSNTARMAARVWSLQVARGYAAALSIAD